MSLTRKLGKLAIFGQTLIKEAVIAGDRRLVDQLTANALDQGVEAAFKIGPDQSIRRIVHFVYQLYPGADFKYVGKRQPPA